MVNKELSFDTNYNTNTADYELSEDLLNQFKKFLLAGETVQKYFKSW